jgi:hypothetical protein
MLYAKFGNDAVAWRPVIGEHLSPPITKVGGCF